MRRASERLLPFVTEVSLLIWLIGPTLFTPVGLQLSTSSHTACFPESNTYTAKHPCRRSSKRYNAHQTSNATSCYVCLCIKTKTNVDWRPDIHTKTMLKAKRCIYQQLLDKLEFLGRGSIEKKNRQKGKVNPDAKLHISEMMQHLPLLLIEEDGKKYDEEHTC